MATSLPAPPVVPQEPAMCWLAAFESWDQATRRYLGVRGGGSQTVSNEDLRRWVGGAGHLSAAGRAADDGVRVMAGVGCMQISEHRGADVTEALLDRLLADGYVYCAYYWDTGRPLLAGHAVVIYGVSGGTVRYMDPARGRGLTSVAASFFAKESVRVTLGVSLLAGLGRDVAASLAGLR